MQQEGGADHCITKTTPPPSFSWDAICKEQILHCPDGKHLVDRQDSPSSNSIPPFFVLFCAVIIMLWCKKKM